LGKAERPDDGKILHLAAFLDSYAEAVEADLARIGIDLRDLYRGGLSYRRLGVLIAHLPPESATKTAIREDADEADIDSPPPDPSRHGPWSTTDLLLALIADGINVLAWQNTQVHGKKRTEPPAPIRRPGVKTRTQGQISEAGVIYLNRLREERRRQLGDSGR
jgi:hypothetical protein